MQKKSRILSVVLLVLIGVFLFGLIAPLFLNDMLKSKIENQINTQLSDKGNVEINRIRIHFWGQSVIADSVDLKFESDSIAAKSILLPRLEVDGIKWMSLIHRDIPEFGQLKLAKPQIQLQSRDLSFSSSASSKNTTGSESSLRFSAFNLKVDEGSITIRHPQGDSLLHVKSFTLNAENLNPGSLKREYFDEIDFQAKGISGKLREQLYNFKMDQLNYSSNFQSAAFYNLELIPTLPKYEFSQARGKQIDRLDLSIPEIRVKGFNSDSIATEIDSLIVDDAQLEVFRNKQMERDPNDPDKLLLNDVATRIKFPFRLKTLQVNNSTVVYAEHRPPSDTLASVSFNRMDGEVSNFSSAAHPQFKEDTLKLHAETYFMNTSLLTVDVNYPVFREDDRHILWAKLDSINPKAAGDMLRYVGFVQVNSGMVHDLETQIILTDSTSSGSVTIIYSDLDISLVNKNNPDANGIKEAITDFITDNFIIHSENPADDPRKGEIYFEREKEKSIFAYWWKSLLSGIKSSVK